MTIAESLYFMYDNISSKDMGIINVNRANGLQEETFLPEREIKEVYIRGRQRPYFVETTMSPLTIPLRFMFEDKFDEDKIRNVARWLNQPFFKPLYFSDNPNRIYYAMYIGSSELLHNSLKQGYVDLQMRNIDCFTYSNVYSRTFDFTNNTPQGTTIELINLGDVNCYPTLTIHKKNQGEIRIVSYSNGGQELKLTGLANGETVMIDCEEEEITTDLPLTYRYDNHNGIYLELLRGVNRLQVFGQCELKVQMQFKTLQG